MLVGCDRNVEVEPAWEVVGHPLAPEAEKVDLHGRRVILGLIDTHMHFTAYAEGKQAVDFSEYRSILEIVDKLKARAKDYSKEKWTRGNWSTSLSSRMTPGPWNLRTSGEYVSDPPGEGGRNLQHAVIF